MSRRYEASAHQSMGVSERPANVVPKGGALAWVVVRASSPRAKHSNQSRTCCSGEIPYGKPSPASQVFGAVIWKQWCFFQTGEVPAVSIRFHGEPNKCDL